MRLSGRGYCGLCGCRRLCFALVCFLISSLIKSKPHHVCQTVHHGIVQVGSSRGRQCQGEKGSARAKKGPPQMFKGGVIMDVVNPEQAKVAEAADACAVMALERIPPDIRNDNGGARSSDPQMIKAIMNPVSIPAMAKVRIGHFVSAKILQEMGVDCIDENEVLSVDDAGDHVNKNTFKVPFVYCCRILGEALRRLADGCGLIRTKGEAGDVDIVEAVRHVHTLHEETHLVQKRSMASSLLSVSLLVVLPRRQMPLSACNLVLVTCLLEVPSSSSSSSSSSCQILPVIMIECCFV